MVHQVSATFWKDTNTSSDIGTAFVVIVPNFRKSQMIPHRQIKNFGQHAPEKDWKKDIQTAEKYEQYWQRIYQMLKELGTTWNAHLWQIKVAIHRIALEPSNQHPISLVPYRPGHRAKDSKKIKSNRCSLKNLLNQARPNGRPQYFLHRKHILLRFCVDHQ